MVSLPMLSLIFLLSLSTPLPPYLSLSYIYTYLHTYIHIYVLTCTQTNYMCMYACMYACMSLSLTRDIRIDGAIHQSMKVSPDEDNDSHSQHPPVVNSSSEKARDLSIHPSSLRQDLSLTLEFEISSDHEAFKSSSSHSSPPLVEFWAHTSWPAFT